MNRRSFLVLSFGLNLVLTGIVAWAAKSRAAAAVPPRIPEPITNRVVRTRPFTNPPGPAVIEVAAPFNWAQVESTDYRIYIANLRAIGCPEATIHDMVEADVNALFAERVQRLNDGLTGYFWNFMTDRTKTAALLEDKIKELGSLDDRREQTMRDLFPEDDPQSKAAREKTRANFIANLKWQYDFLSEEKVARIFDAYERMITACNEIQRTNPPAEELERQFKELSDRQDREIQESLTAEEYDEYKLRTADAANVRYGLSNLEATEDEIRAIARAKMNSQGDEAIRQILGPERFAAYQRATDGAYQQTLRIADRFDLPAETAVQVYQMQKEAETQARAIRDDTSRSVEERREILRAIREEAERAIGGVLGPKVFKAYRKFNGGWLTEFSAVSP